MLLRATPAWSSVGGFSTTTIALASAPAPNGEGAGAHDAPAPPSTRVTCWHAAHCTDCAVPAYASVRPHPAHWQCATAWLATFTVWHSAHRTEEAPLSYARRTRQPAQSNCDVRDEVPPPSGTAVTVEHKEHRTFEAPCAGVVSGARDGKDVSGVVSTARVRGSRVYERSRLEKETFAASVARLAREKRARRAVAFSSGSVERGGVFAHVSRTRASGVVRVPAGTPATCDTLRPRVRCTRCAGRRRRLGLRAEGEGVSVGTGVAAVVLTTREAGCRVLG